MKTIAAILLSGILLFNWVGYQLLNGFMQDKANRQLEYRLDHQRYDEAQLISIKIPIKHLSYYSNSLAFERVDGRIDIDGVPYQYVKRRIFNDSLEVLCIPNRALLKLRACRDDYFRTVNDIQRTQQGPRGSHPRSSRAFLTDDPYTITGSPLMGCPFLSRLVHTDRFSAGIVSTPRSPEEKPPAFHS